MGNTSLGDEAAAGAANAGKADDLLAQLAGDEIDKLLADADEKAGTPTEPEPAAAPAAVADVDDKELAKTASAEASAEAAAVAPAVLAALGEPLAPLVPLASTTPPPAAVAEAAKEPVAEETDAALAGELDKLFDELKKDPEPDAPDSPAGLAAPVEPAPVAEQAPAAEQTAETPAVAIDDATTAEERGGLIEEVAEEPAEDDTTRVIVEVKLPIYLRPLEWINAPFAFLPDRARDLLGTIGIVTLMNAAAILVYLRLMRKH